MYFIYYIGKKSKQHIKPAKKKSSQQNDEQKHEGNNEGSNEGNNEGNEENKEQNEQENDIPEDPELTISEPDNDDQKIPTNIIESLVSCLLYNFVDNFCKLLQIVINSGT